MLKHAKLSVTQFRPDIIGVRGIRLLIYLLTYSSAYLLTTVYAYEKIFFLTPLFTPMLVCIERDRYYACEVELLHFAFMLFSIFRNCYLSLLLFFIE